MPAEQRAAIIKQLAQLLVERQPQLLAANQMDLRRAQQLDLAASSLGRLTLTPAKIKSLAVGQSLLSISFAFIVSLLFIIIDHRIVPELLVLFLYSVHVT